MSNMLRAPRVASNALRSPTTPAYQSYIGCSSYQLPSVRDALRLIKSYRQQPKAPKKGISEFCVSSKAKSKEAECLKDGGCVDNENACLAFNVKRPYSMAGLVTVSDQAIEGHLKRINEDHRTVLQLEKKSTPSAEARKTEYQAEILKIWDILDPNARVLIENDPHRSEKAEKEDLMYYEDFFGANTTRRMCLFNPNLPRKNITK